MIQVNIDFDRMEAKEESDKLIETVFLVDVGTQVSEEELIMAFMDKRSVGC